MARLVSNTLAALFAVSVLSTAITAKDTPGKAGSQIIFIQVGHISRIDAKSHTVMLWVSKDDQNGQTAAPPPPGGFGRGGRFGRIGGPTPQDIARQRAYETKVVVKSETVLKDREGTLRFDDLKAGDFVEVEGVMHGNDFEAKELRRHSSKTDSPNVP
jgi:hypothetical protein